MAIRNFGDFLIYHERVFGPSDGTRAKKSQATESKDMVEVGIIISPKRPRQGINTEHMVANKVGITQEERNLHRASAENRSHEDWNLHRAAEENRFDIASALIARRYEVNGRDDVEQTPLHKAVDGNSFDVAQLLIEHGAEVDAKTVTGSTSLHYAAWSNFLNVAELLIKHGADVDAKTDLGNSALHFAAKQQSLGMTQLLIGNGANTEGVDLSWMDDQEDA